MSANDYSGSQVGLPGSYVDYSVLGEDNPYTGHVLHRHLKVALPVAVRGEGAHIFDSKGKRYLDASGGAAVSALGHSDPDVIAAMKAQIDKLSYAHSGFFTTEALEELAARVCDRAPESFQHAYMVSGGSEAVEAALKLARQYFTELGQPQKFKFIARRQSYHGNTLGALGVGGNAWRKAKFEPIMVPGILIEPCYEYRFRKHGESEEEYGLRAANALEAAILHEGPENVAAFVAETIGGATAGALTAVGPYFRRVREICDQYNVLLLLDEVMCGSGRTGTFFAFEQEGVVPDLVTLAKALGAGYQPIGATLISSRIMDALGKGSGFFQHGHTYLGHAVACAAANAVQKKIDRENLLDNVTKQGERLMAGVKGIASDFIGNVRGRGLFVGIELVRDQATKEPFSPKDAVAKRIRATAMDKGLMCYPMAGTVDGQNGDHILLAPPFIATAEHVDEIVSIIASTINDVCKPLAAG